jgi:diguanylate cyclase (GGDEF)-like protein
MSPHAARPSIHDLSAIAHAVARATDRQTAFETLVGELSQALNTRACILQRIDRGWTLVAQTRGGLGVTISDLQLAVGGMSTAETTAAVDSHSIGEGVWTSMRVEDPGGPLAILLAGDWTLLERVALNPLAVLLSFALTSLHDRETRQATERWLIDGFAMARRLSRLGGLEPVAQRVVEQIAHSLNADRVALALYRPDEDRLSVVAAHGYSAALVKDVRIERGSWVIGHVYARGRPVVVRDVRQVHGMALERRQYRTFSFAAVPIVAGTQTVGVLTATDKKDGSFFDARDAIALRMFGASASLALMAARNDTELHRLAYAATVDSLTELFNRPYFDERLHQEIERAKRQSSSLTLLMADVDDFKTINDTHGHPIGDVVLQAVAGVLRSSVRIFDVCSRYGGDEFAILMLSSDQSSAAACAERIRQRVSECEVKEEGGTRIPRTTLSIGVAVMGAGDGPTDLIRRADQSMYHAKAAGKNLISVDGTFPHAPQPPLIGPAPGAESA